MRYHQSYYSLSRRDHECASTKTNEKTSCWCWRKCQDVTSVTVLHHLGVTTVWTKASSKVSSKCRFHKHVNNDLTMGRKNYDITSVNEVYPLGPMNMETESSASLLTINAKLTSYVKRSEGEKHENI